MSSTMSSRAGTSRWKWRKGSNKMIKLITTKEADQFFCLLVNTRFHAFLWTLATELGLDPKDVVEKAKGILTDAEIPQE